MYKFISNEALLYFQHLPVIQCSTIVRCRACRTYINPFVYFNDSKRWKCNLCYRVNECKHKFVYFKLFLFNCYILIFCSLCYCVKILNFTCSETYTNIIFIVPEEFQFDPVTKLYGDPSRRPEIRTSTIEFIAPSEYMVKNLKN